MAARTTWEDERVYTCATNKQIKHIYIYIYVYAFIHIYIYTYIYKYVSIDMRTYPYMCFVKTYETIRNRGMNGNSHT